MSSDTGNLVPPGRALPRRRFLELVVVSGAGALAAPLLAGCSSDDPGGTAASVPPAPAAPPGYEPAYPLGVMAGDPAPDGSVIWTRLAPTGAPDLDVLWEVATDETFAEVVAGGVVGTGPDRDHTVAVRVQGLAPDRWYRYRFTVGTTASPVGRLRTAPDPAGSPSQLRFAWASCQQITASTYVAHRAIQREPDLDFWMHLGDYVYVSDRDTLALDDYRAVYARFKANPELQALQAWLPTVAMFDDGEFVNGIDRTLDSARKAAALQAWFEQFPVLAPADDPTRAHRALAWGLLADLFMLDVRQYRDPAVDAIDSRSPEGAVMFEPDRTTLGAEQRSWLLEGLGTSAAAWRVLGNPYNMGMWRLADFDEGPPRPDGVHPNEGNYAPNEAWDDYWAERRTILEHLGQEGIADTVSVSGHTHIWLADHLSADPDDPASPVVAFDFTCGSLTADPDVLGGDDDRTAEQRYQSMVDLAAASIEINPWQEYVNFINHGYGVATVTPERAVFEFKGIDTYDLDAEPVVLARFTVERGADRMRTETFETPLYAPPA